MSPEIYAGFRGAQLGEPMADKLECQQVVGSLLHPAQCTCPDIALPVSALAAYAAAPSEGHHAALLDIVGYRQHSSVGHHLWWQAAATGVLMQCKLCSMP
jgi:hypothetical protein